MKMLCDFFAAYVALLVLLIFNFWLFSGSADTYQFLLAGDLLSALGLMLLVLNAFVIALAFAFERENRRNRK